jgi:hypothetical protein
MHYPREHAAERPVARLYVSISDTARLTGLSTVTVYRLIAKEKLVCVKAGAKSLVEVASIRRYLASLPRFVGTTGGGARDSGREDDPAERAELPDPSHSQIRPRRRTPPGPVGPAPAGVNNEIAPGQGRREVTRKPRENADG